MDRSVSKVISRRKLMVIWLMALLATHAGLHAAVVKVVAFGDSTTAKRVVDGQPLSVWADLLNEHVSIHAINAGIPGNNTNDARARFERDVLSKRLDVVVIQFGINDAAVDVWKNPSATESRVSQSDYVANLRFFISELKRRDVKVYLMTPNPAAWTPKLKQLYGKPPYDVEDEDGFNVLLKRYAQAARDLANETDTPLIDVYQHFQAYGSQSGQSVSDLLLDGMHPNAVGHRMIAGLLFDEMVFEPVESGAPVTIDAAGNNEGALAALPDGSLRLFFTNPTGQVSSTRSLNSGRTWSEPQEEFTLPGKAAHAAVALVDKEGEIHLFYLQWRGEGKIAVDRFLDIGHVKSTDGRTKWLQPKIIWRGYCGSIRSAVQMNDGRIVLPFAAWQADRSSGPPTGSNVTTNVYSDDGDETWQLSEAALVSPCVQGYNGSNYGACEPSLIPLGDGRLWMLMRTQTGVLYESFSKDGANWTDARPTSFYSSNSPMALLRLRDGRLVLFWNNSLMPQRVDGQGVYGGRDALHAAISSDDGRTWRGFREVYRDPLRNQSPPKSGDRGTAYPTAVQADDGSIIIATGQGKGRRAILRFDPDWLEDVQHADDFSNGLDGWHVFKSFGPARGWWRDRTQGPVLIEQSDASSGHALHIRRPDDNAPDGAAWNFPNGRSGTLKIRVKLNEGFGGGSIALTDRLFNPTDARVADEAMFHLKIAANGTIGESRRLEMGTWQTLEVQWNLDAKRCVLHIDGRPAGAIPLKNPTTNGISYLHLQSTAKEVDQAGFYLDFVKFDASQPVMFLSAESGITLHPTLSETPGLPMGPFTRTKNGDIIAVDHNDFIRSGDEGKTWQRTAIFTADDNFKISNERAIVVTKKGTIIVACMNLAERHWTWDNKLGDAPGAKLPTYVLRSTDGGKTWEKPRKMHDDWSGAVRDIVETKDGRIVFTAMKMRHNPGRHTVLTYGSSDDGETWEPSNVIDLGGAGHHGGVTEPCIEQLNDGRLIKYIRTNWMKQWWAESRDDGRSWHVMGPTDIPSSSAPAMLTRLADGRLLIVWNRPFPDGKDSYPMSGGDRLWSATPVSNHRAELSIAFSSDEGKTWSTPQVIASVSKGWLAYPYVFEPKPGTVWITTMQGGLRATLNLADLE